MSLVDIPESLLWRLRDHGLGRVGTPNGSDAGKPVAAQLTSTQLGGGTR